MRARGWAGIGLAVLIGAALLRTFVRIVPADAPEPSRPAAAEAGALLIPVEGVPPSALSDTFAQARASGARAHDAIDIMAARGRAVLAAADGRIEKLFWSEEGGRTIYERSPDGRRIYYYAHLDGYAPGLAEGQAVRRGQRIATVGSTGNADPAAPHLHFAVHELGPGEPWHGGRAINPYPLLAKPR
ncbi:M23 family metallopeptidase [Sphingobium fuliginis]|uniref:M23 family metallopeptidase n=1 Tax=Sphingobium fuliginis ATCC 27551 TaxID=1208342 RepID=A0A5B8CD49_SPHSA|nr:M23 family metallopeptidase [Sphingobium fuliginis]QDC37468.1 M23 family metallopeptidase [Sphingobium fuliginis ATCC 27551]